MRKCRQFRRRAVTRPVTNHQHLHGRWRIGGNGKKGAGGRRAVVVFTTRAEMHQTILDRDCLINGNRTSRAALNFKGLWSEILPGAKCGRERHFRTAVGELEVNFGGKRVAVASDLVRFFPKGLLELMQGKFALLDHCRRSLLSKAGNGKRCVEKKYNGEGTRFQSGHSEIWIRRTIVLDSPVCSVCR